jgi:hypothetical protein
MMNKPNLDSAITLSKLNNLLAVENVTPLKLDMPAWNRFGLMFAAHSE